MRYLDIKEFDLVNGDGMRVSLWISGCEFRCKGCHNTESWDRNNGKLFGNEEENYLFYVMDKGVNKNLSILGGEPLSEYNRDDVLNLCKRFKKRFPFKNIWLWTGYDIEEIEKEFPSILEYLDVIICGRYIEELKCNHQYYGSLNQKVIYLPKK